MQSRFNRTPGPRVALPGQLELPQTEERPADLARLQAAAPMRAKAPQKPCDVGLFGDDAAQIDLEDLTGR